MLDQSSVLFTVLIIIHFFGLYNLLLERIHCSDCIDSDA